MKEKLRKQRNKLLYQAWEQLKNTLTMEELAEIFGIPLPTTYKLIREQEDKLRSIK